MDFLPGVVQNPLWRLFQADREFRRGTIRGSVGGPARGQRRRPPGGSRVPAGPICYSEGVHRTRDHRYGDSAGRVAAVRNRCDVAPPFWRLPGAGWKPALRTLQRASSQLLIVDAQVGEVRGFFLKTIGHPRRGYRAAILAAPRCRLEAGVTGTSTGKRSTSHSRCAER